MKIRRLGAIHLCLFSLGLGIATVADAALFSRLDGQAVYQDDIDVTWIADTRLPDTRNFGVTGNLTWDRAFDWIDGMNAANYLGFNDWRLPTADPSCTNNVFLTCANALESTAGTEELAYLFYKGLGGTFGSPVLTTAGDPGFAFFPRGTGDWYYTSTESSPDEVHAFSFRTGFEDGRRNKRGGVNLIAVRDGDVLGGGGLPGGSPVPIPAAVWLFGSGFLGLVGVARRRGVS